MKKRLISMLLVICMVVTLLPNFTFAVSAAEGDLPATLSVEPSEINNIPAAIDLYSPSNSWGGSSTGYHLYLPGNTDAANCFFSWADGLEGTVDGKTYASGEMPVPAVGETKTITFSNATGSKSFEVTTYQGSANVKTMFIEIDESQVPIADMNNDPDHETECTGVIYIDGEEHVLDKIKGRGNATWTQAKQKRPYNITLGKKVSSILGIEMPDKTKKFSLLANIADRSLLRNKVGYDIAYEMGIGLDSASVDLWMNGKYIGLYLVVPKNDSFVSDAGYAVENDNYKEPPISEGGDPSFDLEGLNTVNKPNLADYEHNRITVKKIGDDLLPNGETEEELTRVAGEIQAWMQDMWDAIRSEDGYNAKGKYYTDYVDVESWAKMYLMQEYAKGFDANAGSLLFHRDGTTDDDKMFAGPLWDLDNALGSTQINSYLGSQVDQRDANGWFMRNLSDDKTSIYKYIGKHEDFMEAVYIVYNQYAELFDNAPKQVVALAEEIADSAEMNYKKVTQESYNTVSYSSETVLSRGTDYEQTYKKTNDWQDYVDNLETFTTVRSKFLRDNVPVVELCEHEYAPVVTEPTCTEGGYTTYTCALCGKSYVDDKTDAAGHTYENGFCSVCGAEEITEFVATIVCDENSSVTVYESKDTTGPCVENAEVAYARNGDTGEIDVSGDGQINFVVNVAEGYKIKSITAEPAGNYKNLKDPADTGVENGYRITKVKGDLTITVTTAEEGGLESIDFTQAASADRFTVINQASTAIREGEGLYLITTTDAFEDCNGQISTFTPKDVVKIPVGGDWTATMKFNFSQAGAANGYYQFFGFYAAEGDDYQNLAGIRGGDQAMQNFLRVGGTITADSADLNSAPGLASEGTYWWRIVKEGTTYTCYRSDDGASFNEMFSYADTGIEADSIIIDAYTGMTTGYEFIVESLSFEGGEGGGTVEPKPEDPIEPDPTGELPENLSVEPSETNNIPAAIDLFQTSSSSSSGGWPGWGGGWGGGTTTTSNAYDLYLPGNTDVANCFLSWEGGLKASVDGNSYASGELPVPAVGETKTITFNNGTEKTFQVTTYQGSESIKSVFIEIDESQGTIAEMNASKDNSCSGVIFFDGEEHVLDKMKGRGNATWSQAVEKRPYNITLGSKVASGGILGIETDGKNKKFSLLANVADRSLLRNKVGFDIAYEMGIGLDSVSVDLWMNGVYYGVYQVMAKNDYNVTDDGYIVENDNYKEPSIADGGDPSFELEGLNTVNKQNLAAHEYNRISVKAIGDNLLPNGETDEELARVAGEIQAWMQDMWDAIRSADGYNDEGKYYTEYVDITSWAKMYLMQEFVKNYDANAGSLKFYREATGEDDKMFAGPLWDLDNALGSTQVNSLLGNQVDQTDANGWFMNKLSEDKTSIYKTIGKHEDFKEEVYRVYDEYKYLFDNASTQVVELAEEMADSAAMNFKRITRENYNTVNYGTQTVKSAGTAYEQTYKATNSWQDYVDNLETFTRVRAKFLSDNLPNGIDSEPPVESGTLPETLSVEPSETNNIPAAIDLYQASTSTGGGWPGWGGGTTTSSEYDLYLPGNTDIANCFLSWEGGLNATMDGKTYASGELPVPAAGETKTISFNNGTAKTFQVTTWQGSEALKAVFIEIDESQGTIAEMNASKDNSCSGVIFFDGEEHVLDKMKGRGNATWSQAVEKRPYNITLGSKVASGGILGIETDGKNKKFSLLANVADRSLLRNKVGFDIAYEMGIGLDSVSVDLWMNGVYYGVYQVMAKNDYNVTDDGYIVENDNYKEPSIAEGGDPSFELEGLNTVNKQNLAAHEHNRISVKAIGDNLLPNGETDEELARVAGEIQAWMQDMWDAIRSEDGYNDEGKYYTEYVDITSWAKMYLMQEFVKNYDANAGSLKFYREATGEDDKMFAGPLWDLDNALGSTQVNSLLGNQVDQTDANGWFMSKLSEDKTSIYKTIGKHDDFMDEVYRVYDQYKYLFDNATVQVETLAEEMADSAAMNFNRITRENYNTVNYGRETVKSAGTAYEQTYKATNSWQDYVDNLATFTRVRAKFLSDNMPSNCEHEYESVVTKPTCTEEGYTTYTCGLCGRSYVGDKTDALGHDYKDDVCTVCGKTKPVPGAVTSIDFTDPDSESKVVIDNQVSAEFRENGLYLVSTTGAFEPCNGQISTFEPADVVSIPVSGDWTATMKFNFDQGGSQGYYEFFGFYAAEGNDYQNMVGIRGGDGAMQDFLRVDGNVTADTDLKTASGLKAASTHWFRIEKNGDTYICYTSTDGVEFAEAFTFEATGIEADNLVIDAYSGMATGYNYTIESIEFESDGTPEVCEHSYIAVTTDATCTEGGYTTYTCSKCGDAYVADEVAALGHDWDEGVVTKAPTTEAEGEKTYTCKRCEETKTEVLDKLEEGHVHDYKETVVEPTCSDKGYTLYECECGENYKDKETEALGHDYEEVVTKPTCTEKGYSTYTCSRCDNTYKGEEVAALGHTFENGVCTVCGAKNEDYCPAAIFTDAPAKDHWAHEGIDYAVENGLMNGTGNNLFKPLGTLTRAELVTILYRVEETPAVEYKKTFADVKEGEWYTNAIEWAAANGIVNGVGDGKNFAPSGVITREQIATILYRYETYKYGAPKAEGDLKAFPDAADVSTFASTAMIWAIENKIITGASVNGVTYLKPLDSATREQIASIMMRYLKDKKSVSIYPVTVAKDLYTPFSGGEGTEFADGFKTGFGSAITFKGYDEDGNMQFYGASDRGPSLDLFDEEGNEVDNTKVFPAPDFSPVIGVITLKDGEAVVEEAITLKKADGTPLTGLPLPAGETGATGEIALDIYGNELEYDPEGFDPEGIAVDKDGNFWLGDEYGPFIAKFAPDGTMLKMYKPGDGLPEILKYRIANRGFESLTISPTGKVFAVLQSVMNINGETQKTATFIRILELDPETGDTKMYAYPVVVSEYSAPKNCKLGDAYAIDDNTLLIVEQGKLADKSMRNVIYKVDLSEATDITDLTYNGKELEYTSSVEELEEVMNYAEKEVYIDLRTIGWTAEKAEGICLTDTGALVAIIEDDFGMAGSEKVEGSDAVHILPNESDPSQIWVIE